MTISEGQSAAQRDHAKMIAWVQNLQLAMVRRVCTLLSLRSVEHRRDGDSGHRCNYRRPAASRRFPAPHGSPAALSPPTTAGRSGARMSVFQES